MDLHQFQYIFNNGKNPKYKYYIQAYWKAYFPRFILRAQLQEKLEQARRREDYDYILKRVEYYNKLEPGHAFDNDLWLQKALPVGKHKKTHPSVYFFDTMEHARWFPKHLRYALWPGDVTKVPQIPMIVKSRPIDGQNANSVLLNLDKVRHFVFLDDKTDFGQKLDSAIFRGGIKKNLNRWQFLEKYHGNPRVDAAATDRCKPEWEGRTLTLHEHLSHKFVLSLEGNDVASNLKWIMSSNSIAIMPKPTFETWFMEGTLRPGQHYIQIRPDFADLEEKMDFYITHPEEARQIIKNANRHVQQFKDKKREELIALMVLDKYFKNTNP